MLVGMRPNSREEQVQALLRTMQESNIEFHLTGSRFFGTETKISDWDFFCLSTAEAMTFLRLNHFRLHMDYNYRDRDSQIIVVMRHSLGIDVQLVNDYAVKKNAQRLIAAFPALQTELQYLSLRRHIWDQAYQVVHLIMEGEKSRYLG